jgi:hypothetical protein
VRQLGFEPSLGGFDPYPPSQLDVAQPGSAPDLDSGGRRFESCHPDSETVELCLAVSDMPVGLSR